MHKKSELQLLQENLHLELNYVSSDYEVWWHQMFTVVTALRQSFCKTGVFLFVPGTCQEEGTVARVLMLQQTLAVSPGCLKCPNNISVAELCQSENAGDHVSVISGGDIPELQ